MAGTAHVKLLEYFSGNDHLRAEYHIQFSKEFHGFLEIRVIDLDKAEERSVAVVAEHAARMLLKALRGGLRGHSIELRQLKARGLTHKSPYLWVDRQVGDEEDLTIIEARSVHGVVETASLDDLRCRALCVALRMFLGDDG